MKESRCLLVGLQKKHVKSSAWDEQWTLYIRCKIRSVGGAA